MRVLGAVFALLACLIGPASAKQPNIVFMLSDDLSLNLLQYMPNVQAMQKAGVTFSNYFVADSLCCPSRSSIFTGMYPHNTGVLSNKGVNGGYQAFHAHNDQQQTFATRLNTVGYNVAMMGKYLNGYDTATDPADPGWTTWAVADDGYHEFNYALNQDGNVVQYGANPASYLTDVISGLAVKFIGQQTGAKPFFIEVATFAPHRPYVPAPRNANDFPGVAYPRTAAFNAAPAATAPAWLQALPVLNRNEMGKIDNFFRMRAQSVEAIDKMVGDLQAAVAALGVAGDTYFVFSSDNGYHMGDHRMRPGKMTAFDTDIHVPLIVVGPGVVAGGVVDAIVQNIDLCPTFIELGGGEIPIGVDGKSLVPWFNLSGGGPQFWRQAALIEHQGPVLVPVAPAAADPDLEFDQDLGGKKPGKGHANPPSYAALRTAGATYVEYATGETEFYDLTTDPYQLHPAIVVQQDLHSLLQTLKTCKGLACQ